MRCAECMLRIETHWNFCTQCGTNQKIYEPVGEPKCIECNEEIPAEHTSVMFCPDCEEQRATIPGFRTPFVTEDMRA